MIGIGDRVLHCRFGSGTVLAVEEERFLTIRFDAFGDRARLVNSFVMLWGDSLVPLSGRPASLALNRRK